MHKKRNRKSGVVAPETDVAPAEEEVKGQRNQPKKKKKKK